MNNRKLIPLTALSLMLAAANAQIPAGSTSNLPQAAASATHLAVGTIKRIDAEQRLITIDHQAIPSMNMPAMTMQFRLRETVPVTSLSAGQSVAFVLAPTTDGMAITSLQPFAASAASGDGKAASAHGMHGDKSHDMSQMQGMNMMAQCHAMMARK